MGQQQTPDITVDHDLEQAIPYLVARAGSRMGTTFAKALKPYGLSLSEWRVCALLGKEPHQRLTTLTVAACVDMSALSRIVDRLIEQGLVTREKSGDDGRAVRLALTEKGAELTRKIVPMAKHYEDVALQCFSKAEVALFAEMLNRLYASAESLVS
ncbi:MarR family winged helix-turn-helix transcriptional regulator [Cupriavidus sp. UYPR2.512]|uniref:MarR family winged helix-turn-helix transcriptional regulator n=1 Tax=Cupriavidus sp. UYPR2.512 TaxID=1080187 RepID=UPI00035F60F6|nr:MarR family transcriptional regulator [Cupriavidus sp. UYPR2.512]UIF90013.1 MarR family transcriptional regulator [Cupriavidus necator]